MKKTLYFLAFLSCAFFAGCIDDTGNYDYQNPDSLRPIITSQMEEVYDMISLDKLVIDPQMEGDQSRYDYVWYAYFSEMTGIRADTLSRERKLDYTVALRPGNYTLIFQVTDKQNKTMAFQKTSVKVSSIFGVGYYILKADNGMTDLDFVDRNNKVSDNILKTLNGESLEGKPIGISYFSVQYNYQVDKPEGGYTQYSNQPSFWVCSDKDLRVYQGENMTQLKKFEDLFMETPAVKKPQAIATSSIGYMVVNDNTMYILKSAYNMGMFGYPFPKENYQYSKYLLNGTTAFVTWDEAGGRFLGYGSSSKVAVTSDKYKDYQLLYFGAQPMQMFMTYYSYALLKHKTNGSACIVQIMSPNAQAAITYVKENLMPSDAPILNASVFGIGAGTKTVMYYSTGNNEVNYYNYVNQTTRKAMLTLPAGEQIVQIKNVYDAAAAGVNYLLVLSNKDGKWHLRQYDFEGATPDTKTAATKEFTGNGVATSVAYRYPGVYCTY